MADFGTAAYDHTRFLDHATVWSEMKGFALMFQLNPRSPLSATDLVTFHQLVGDAPVLPAAGETAASEHRTARGDPRALLGAAYDFAADPRVDVGAEALATQLTDAIAADIAAAEAIEGTLRGTIESGTRR